MLRPDRAFVLFTCFLLTPISGLASTKAWKWAQSDKSLFDYVNAGYAVVSASTTYQAGGLTIEEFYLQKGSAVAKCSEFKTGAIGDSFLCFDLADSLSNNQ